MLAIGSSQAKPSTKSEGKNADLKVVGFRFRRRVNLPPGLKINLSKSGASVTVGGRGLTENFGRCGILQTVELPFRSTNESESNS
jgi:hypothetical protein